MDTAGFSAVQSIYHPFEHGTSGICILVQNPSISFGHCSQGTSGVHAPELLQ
jgi:hypothetical protein